MGGKDFFTLFSLPHPPKNLLSPYIVQLVCLPHGRRPTARNTRFLQHAMWATRIMRNMHCASYGRGLMHPAWCETHWPQHTPCAARHVGNRLCRQHEMGGTCILRYTQPPNANMHPVKCEAGWRAANQPRPCDGGCELCPRFLQKWRV